jgi:uncharacterized protein YneF (UPF0154 family)
MKFGKTFIKRRWFDGRTGTTTYLLFGLTLMNFILISYRFLIEENTLFEKLISDITIFSIIFIVTYIPISIMIGYWHRKTQWKVELALKQLENPIVGKMIRTILDVQTGKASDKEIKEFREFLIKIENKE